MNLSQLYSRSKRAVEEYDMIQKGDRVAVGISGGKDSLTLLYALHGLSKFKDADFSIHGVMVDMGFDNFDTSPVSKLCQSLDIPFTQIKTQLGDVIFNERNEKNPCSMCSKMRKGILNKKLDELGCNKLAYGHHKDDFIETFLLSLLYEGRFHTMEPKFYMSKSQLTLIRPLLYVSEEEIISFRDNMNLPVIKSPCPVDGKTARETMHQLALNLANEFPGSREKLFSSIKSMDFFI